MKENVVLYYYICETFMCMKTLVLELWAQIVSKLSLILKCSNFKQRLIYTWLNFKNDGFDNEFYFLNQKINVSLNNFVLKYIVI